MTRTSPSFPRALATAGLALTALVPLGTAALAAGGSLVPAKPSTPALELAVLRVDIATQMTRAHESVLREQAVARAAVAQRVRAAQLRAAALRAAQARTAALHAAQVRVAQLRAAQARTTALHAAQVRAARVGAAQARAGREADRRAAQRRAQRSVAEHARHAAVRRSRSVTPPATPSGSPRSIAHAMLAARGQSGQFDCLNSLWNRESGWSVTADNASSSAYGIPQALPGSKMASAGADWRTNPATQIRWGLSYIAGTYGSPCAAWQHSQANNWY